MTHVRVLLLSGSGLMPDILTEVLSLDPGIEVETAPWGPSALAERSGELDVDVVILEQRAKDAPRVFTEMLNGFPRLKVLSITRNGRECFLCSLRPVEVPLGELEAHSLLEVVRGTRPAPSSQDV